MEKTFTTEHILQTKEFKDFYKIANDFCDFIENQPKGKTEFLKALRQYLLNLYNISLILPWVELQSNIDYDDKLNSDEFENTLSFIADRLEGARYYWHVFDPTKQDAKELVCGDLLDDVRDIYQDLKYSIMIFNLDKVDCIENALWQFKFDFDKHWGDHCINALRALHFYLQAE